MNKTIEDTDLNAEWITIEDKVYIVNYCAESYSKCGLFYDELIIEDIVLSIIDIYQVLDNKTKVLINSSELNRQLIGILESDDDIMDRVTEDIMGSLFYD